MVASNGQALAYYTELGKRTFLELGKEARLNARSAHLYVNKAGETARMAAKIHECEAVWGVAIVSDIRY